MILLDVGPLLALIWQRHGAHDRTQDWLRTAEPPLGVCRVTSMGLLRLLSNEVVMGPEVVTRRRAWSLLDAVLADGRFQWWEEPLDLDAQFRRFSAADDTSHRIWTDDYLAAFAVTSQADLATLDRGLAARYPSLTVVTI